MQTKEPQLFSATQHELKKNPLLFYMRQQRRPFVLGISALLITNILDALPPLLVARGIDQIIENKPHAEVLLTAAWLLGITTTLAIFRYAWRVFFGRFHHNTAEDLRKRIFHKMTQLGPGYYLNKKVGELMTLITADVNYFRMAIGPGSLVILDSIFIMGSVLPLMIWLSPSWTWKTLIFLPLVPFFVKRIRGKLMQLFKDQQDKFSELSSVSQETVSGIRVIKSYAQEDAHVRLFNKYNLSYESLSNKSAKVDASLSPILHFTVATGSILLLILGSPQVLLGESTVGTLVAFHRYIQKMLWPMEAIGFGTSFWQQGMASFRRIMELLEAPLDLPQNGHLQLNSLDRIEVKNLQFCYPNTQEAALKNISFTIQKGQTVGIVGPTGSGKSTLVQCLCHVYDVPTESIFFNEHPMEAYNIESLRQQISLIPQEAFLFSDTVQENIALGVPQEPSTHDIQNWTQIVDLDKEIECLPEKYATVLGERGVNLSGGQKQRLTIARALIRRTPVIILDDSLSAIDAETEKKLFSRIQKSLSQNQEQKQTTIMITHRLTSLRQADLILVMNNGSIEAQGSFDELLTTSPTFKTLYSLQEERNNTPPSPTSSTQTKREVSCESK